MTYISGEKMYTPLKDSKKHVILDTDIGPDCDDAGALAVMFYFARKYSVKILMTVNCTSNIYGNGTLDAINSFCGFGETEIAQYQGKGFLDGEEHMKFNRFISENLSERFMNGSLKVSSSSEAYSRLLKGAEDDSIVIITIGQFNTVAEALRNDPSLFNRKVSAVVSMAQCVPSGREYNVFCDAASSQYFFNEYKGPIICSNFEVGETVMSGFDDPSGFEHNPIKAAYYLYTDGKMKRMSWDPTTVHFAFTADEDFYRVSEPGWFKVNDDGSDEFVPDSNGRHFYLIKQADDRSIADFLDSVYSSFEG